MHSYFQKIEISHTPSNSYERDIYEILKVYDQTILNENDVLNYRKCLEKTVNECNEALPFKNKEKVLQYSWSKTKKKEPILEFSDFLTINFYLINESVR
jgi:hypothetical protein